MKIGVYVGSFDPVHKGHLQVIEKLTEKYVDRILVIPTNSYWDKKLATTLKDRIAMLELCKKTNMTIAKKYSNTSFTYQIFDKLEKDYPEDELYLIIGSDNLKDFSKWKQVNKILKHHIIVVARTKIVLTDVLEETLPHNRFLLLSEFPYIEVSSSLIRKLIKEKDFKSLEDKLNPSVIEYIEKHKLYINS